jgi:hypothetical protein
MQAEALKVLVIVAIHAVALYGLWRWSSVGER